MKRTHQEHHLTTHDGAQLYYRHWPAVTQRTGAIVLLHRGHEHAGRMAHLADELALPECDIFAWDARNHGHSITTNSGGQYFATAVRDLQDFIEHIHACHDIEASDIAVIAQSISAVITAAWAHDYAPKVRCLVLAAPAFSIKLRVPFALAGMKMLKCLRGDFSVQSRIRANQLSHDEKRCIEYDQDPLITRDISADMLIGMHATAARVVKDAQAIVAPTQILISGEDMVVNHAEQRAFFRQLGAPVKEMHMFPGFYHDLLGEKERKQPIAKARDFIRKQFEAPRQSIDLRGADKQGYTFEEARRLAQPATGICGLYWSAYRSMLHLAGSVSAGVNVGRKTGFDSGSMLDYVYRNKAAGVGPLACIGRLIDRQYLNAVGWRGIRQRKQHIEELLESGMERLRMEGRPVHVLDIAAGHGRYVLEALEASARRPDSVLLRDFSDINVREGSALINTKGLAKIARFEKGDAFDRQMVGQAAPQPTIGIVSGLYELFPDNSMLQNSLAGLADAIKPGGYLIYTGQPWHPQLEMIARALTSHRGGAAWVMRRRTQAEMDQLVEMAGFDKLEQRIDEWGIFTVSLARRRTPATTC